MEVERKNGRMKYSVFLSYESIRPRLHGEAHLTLTEEFTVTEAIQARLTPTLGSPWVVVPQRP